MMNRLSVVVLLLAALAAGQSPYRLPECVIDEGGVAARPTLPADYIAHGSFHQTTIGLLRSPGSNYVAWVGYWHPRWRPSFHDVAARTIVAPSGPADTVYMIYPTAEVRNNGSVGERFWTYFLIRHGVATVYRESLWVAVASGATRTVYFPGRRMTQLGPHVACCSVYLAGDENRQNDTASRWFKVMARPPWPENWAEIASMPAPPSNRAVKAGGWLVYVASPGRFYAAKGNKTGDYYSFDAQSGRWSPARGIPNGRDGRAPGRGAAATTDGRGYVYATKGNNTLGFWRYDCALDSWLQRADVPFGPYGKRVKTGTDVAWADHDGVERVYLLKGYKTDFYRYSVLADSWERLPDAPTGRNPKWDQGSWLVWDGANSLYAHKAVYHEMWRFDLTTLTWDTLPRTGMPLVSGQTGRTKKSKNGGCGTWDVDRVAAFKGGNTQEFWTYFPDGDTWHELDTIPGFGSSGRRVRIRDGADIVAMSPGVYFALKGSKSNEFWRYVAVPGATAPAPPRSGVMAGTLPRGSPELTVATPARGRLEIGYGLPSAGAARLELLDVSGRIVREHPLVGTGGRTALALNGLPAGAYFVRLRAGTLALTRQVLVLSD